MVVNMGKYFGNEGMGILGMWKKWVYLGKGKRKEMKRKTYIGFDFCKGGANK